MDANLKREKPAEMLRVEAAYCGGEIVGLRITADNPEDPLLIWADNSFMKGFRVGKEFVAGWGEKIEYRDVVIGEPEPAAPAAAIAPKPDEWDVRGHLAASLTFWHRLKGDEADELVAALQSWATRTQPAAITAQVATAWATVPEGWVSLTITHEGQYTEEIAYGPQRMMDRLVKWLWICKYFDKPATPAQMPDLQPLHNLLYLAQRQNSLGAMRCAITEARLELAKVRDGQKH